jgi:2-polyprenyl-3-methyl-5-hydroxy-6-metoxy-1,4-benzoquinol methylase
MRVRTGRWSEAGEDMIPSLTRRERIPELMDDPALDADAHHQALRGLARLNRWSRSDAVLWPVVDETSRRNAGRPIKVLDVATGAGDVPIALWRRAKKAGLAIEFSGCDVSETALEHARQAAAGANAGIAFFHHDAVRDPLPNRYDLVTCSLFLHHLSEAEAATLLVHLRDAADAVAINDLDRSRLNHLLVWIATRVLSRSAVVHFDGPASVRSAFTWQEAEALAERAGMSDATVERRIPARFLLTWRRP